MEDKLDRALRLHEESFALRDAGDLDGAAGHCREALALFEDIDGPEHPDVANLLQGLGSILEQQCRYEEAQECAARAVAIMDAVAHLVEGPEAGLILIQSLGLLGTALRQNGLYREAEPALKRAVELAENHPDPDALPGALNNLGVLYKYSGNFDEAERVYTRALQMVRERYGEQHPMTAT